jgi:hypothetical protein
MKINVKKNDTISLNNQEVKDVETFLHLGATMDKTEGSSRN